ncbi:hypothetical protein ccbrp13_02210 [Ktedonobacteria bacterium brp13]|nr:hypothetical protein ccbrp13_02210 [Ktedonobacteria bacterium brp13]
MMQKYGIIVIMQSGIYNIPSCSILWKESKGFMRLSDTIGKEEDGRNVSKQSFTSLFSVERDYAGANARW